MEKLEIDVRQTRIILFLYKMEVNTRMIGFEKKDTKTKGYIS